jgi:cyclase
MLTKRIIPCLDIRNGRTVKGIRFEDLRDMGDPVELGAYYAAEGADELVFLDITATQEGRKTFSDLVTRIAMHLNIPFTVGGGIRSISDVSGLLQAGADKISINTAAFRNPELLDELAAQYGSQCVVLAIDTRFEEGEWIVYVNGGKERTDSKAFDWAREGVERGAGEILLTSMTHDGTRSGFALDITEKISTGLPVPVIASGGAGTYKHFSEVFELGLADAALAAGIFHSKEMMIGDLKEYLIGRNIAIRL